MISSASCRPSSSRNTAHFSFIIVPSSSLISETRRPAVLAADDRVDPPLLVGQRRLARRVGIAIPLARSAACSPERRPKISVSSSEFAPRRLPPWTETHATSPAAYRPGMSVAPSTSVLTPPMM